MSKKTKRTTVYFEPEVHRAIRLRAAASDLSFSAIVEEAVCRALAEDAEDIAAIDARKDEPSLKWEDVVADLKARGEL